MTTRPILLSASLLLLTACGRSAEGSAASSSTKTKSDDAASSSPAKSAPTKKPPADLRNATDDELKAAVTAVGFTDPLVMRDKESEYRRTKIFVGNPKVALHVYDFGAISIRNDDFPPRMSLDEKRLLRVSAMKGVGSEALIKSTFDLLQKSACGDVDGCSKVLAGAGYGDINPLGGRTQLGPLGYQLINAKKGSEYVRTQIYDMKPERPDTQFAVKDPLVIAAFSDDPKAPAPKEAISRMLDCVQK